MAYWLAIITAAVLSMAIGSLWYGPLFGRSWMNLMEFTKRDIEKAKEKGMGKTYLFAFISSLVMAFVLAILIVMTSSLTFIKGTLFGFLVWIGFIATTLLGSALWESKPLQLYLINSFEYLVVLLIIGGILGVWL